MTSVNCSYTDGAGIVVIQLCDTGVNYCCHSNNNKYCSNTSCSTDSGIDFKTIAFWAVLGGLLVIALVTVTLVYFICYARNPKGCFSRSPVDELFHEDQVHTVTSETHMPTNDNSAATVVWKTEKMRKVTRKERSSSNLLGASSSQPITICVTPRDGSTEPLKCNEHKLSGQKLNHLMPHGKQLASPRPGQSHVTFIGARS